MSVQLLLINDSNAWSLLGQVARQWFLQANKQVDALSCNDSCSTNQPLQRPLEVRSTQVASLSVEEQNVEMKCSATGDLQKGCKFNVAIADQAVAIRWKL